MDLGKKIIKNIIFDLDNTLYDEKDFIFKFINSLKKKYNFKFFNRKVYLKNKVYERKNFIQFILKNEKKYTKKLHNQIFLEFLNSKIRIKIFKNLDKILTLLKKKKIKLIILTNGNPIVQQKKIYKLKLKKYFNYIFFARKIYKDKPSQKTFRIILRKSNAKCNETLMIGDNYYTDIIGAKKSGLMTLLLFNDVKKSYDYKNIDFKAKSLNSLIFFLKKIITYNK